ncbi:MAG: hypothetical protein JW801_18720 [Bacteroidales bacterium]|nr:hypothetical protein [Bacteroidales bacterium]
MQKRPLLLSMMILLVLVSCIKDPVDTTHTYDVKGIVQKGPFINGSEITLYELNNEYTQTGNSFNTTTNELGQFSFEGIGLASPYVEIIGDGFYFNEISGELSSERISLKAIGHATPDSTLINVNILTHLEFERVKYLITEEGLSLDEAKTQAQEEILSIFEMKEYAVWNPEYLDISKTGEGNAILLALSAIFQGNHTTSELSLLLADFTADIKTDGLLDDTLIQSELLGQALALNCEQIGQNVTDKYTELGVEIEEINSFETFINHFTANSSFGIATVFSFPDSTGNGPNVLNPDLTDIKLITQYSFAVDMPSMGKIMINMRKLSGDVAWGYQPFHNYGWKVSEYGATGQTFTSTVNGERIDLPIEFYQSGSAEVEYYYNGSETPSFTKTITWGGQFNTEFIFLDESPAGPNMLNMAEGTALEGDTTYTVTLQKPGDWDIDFVLDYSEGMTIEVPMGWGNYDYEDTGGQVNFTLSGTNESDYISEIVFKLIGTGTLNLSSPDLDIREGEILNRNFTVY